MVAWLSQYMESHGVETQRRDRSGQTPLHLAARAGHASAVAVLVAHGADVTAKVSPIILIPLRLSSILLPFSFHSPAILLPFSFHSLSILLLLTILALILKDAFTTPTHYICISFAFHSTQFHSIEYQSGCHNPGNMKPCI